MMKAHRQADSRRTPVLHGDVAMWVFILAELLVFGIFFASYALARRSQIVLFNEGQATLNTTIGAVNTGLLLTGSLCAVLAVQAVSQDRLRLSRRWLIAAILCGASFVILKLTEFADKLDAGISLSTNTFYMFYLSLTFFHFMHVLLGMVILLVLFLRVARETDRRILQNTMESGAAYWHMVDLVWVILFPLVYVLR